MDTINKKYYVYKWYFVETGEIFHIGKGSGNRYKDIKNHRNQYFINILNKYGDKVTSEIIVDNLYEADALNLERKLIAEYKKIGWCKTNLHEGGCGGNTGNYDNPERSRKLSESAKTRTGSKNPMWHHQYTKEQLERMSKAQKGKIISEQTREKLRIANTGKRHTMEARMKMSEHSKGRKKSKTEIIHNMYAQNSRYFIVRYNDTIIYVTMSTSALYKFSKDFLKISRTILDKILSNQYVPKFGRNLWLKDIKIEIHTLDESIKQFLLVDEEIEKFYFSDEIVSVLNSVENYHYIKTENYKTHKNRTETAKNQKKNLIV